MPTPSTSCSPFPGALIALGLAYLAALGTVERDRRDLALLRARGATRRDLLVMAGVESAVIGLVAGLAGSGLAFLAVSAVVKGGVGLTLTRAAVTAAACVGLAIAGAAAARIGASVSVLRASVADSRRSGRREGKPLWQRLYLDWFALAISGLIYWLTASTGFSAVVNPDSNPTLSLSIYMFFAPALLWIGATLLLVRLRGRGFAWLARQAAGGRADTARGFLLASAGRRGAAINRGLVVVGLLLAFGVNLGIFSATYNRQAAVDAQLTLGADVTVTAPPGVTAGKHLPQRIAQVPGVQATTALDHSYAYIGPDLQDTYGINPATFTGATTLRDSYFIGDSASSAISKLKSTPDGILVGKETITDYSLAPGDLLKLRVLDRSTAPSGLCRSTSLEWSRSFRRPRRTRSWSPTSPICRRSAREPDPMSYSQRPAAIRRRFPAESPQLHARTERSSRTSANRPSRRSARSPRSTSAESVASSRPSRSCSRPERWVCSSRSASPSVNMSSRRWQPSERPCARWGPSSGAKSCSSSASAWSSPSASGSLLSEMLVAMLQHVFDPPPDALAIPGASSVASPGRRCWVACSRRCWRCAP